MSSGMGILFLRENCFDLFCIVNPAVDCLNQWNKNECTKTYWASSLIKTITLIYTVTCSDFLIFLCSLLSHYTFSTKIVWHMSFICNLEHISVSFVVFCENLFSIFTRTQVKGTMSHLHLLAQKIEKVKYHLHLKDNTYLELP